MIENPALDWYGIDYWRTSKRRLSSLLWIKDKFQCPTTRANEIWQTDFTYFKITGWEWYYLSTVLDDFSRFIIAWRLCTTMSTHDVADTLDDALRFTGLDAVKIKHKPRLLSDNGPSYISSELAHYLEGQNMTHTQQTLSSSNSGQNCALALFPKKTKSCWKITISPVN